MIGVLEEAHNEIGRHVEQNQAGVAMDLLAQCQECAIRLGGMIEAEEGAGFVTVPLLESYCETVYRIYGQISDAAGGQPVRAAAKDNGRKCRRSLNRALVPIGNSIRNDIAVRREAVFLPYKASMWDSLESVWMAADGDPDCDAYVVPIPYYDRNPDGSFGEMHYEGGEFPEDVPITHYDDYDMAGRRPDMTFIHNPYDDCNMVTSVHPFFYTKNLKRFTDRLVYIPYFVLDEIDPGDRQAVEGMRHFCTVPAVVNADRVFVQSEDMRRIYIDVLAEAAGEETRGMWEEKILGLGSPKMDRVLDGGGRDARIPDGWKKHIEKPDGGRKKVVFYNTSIGAFLEHREKMLEKMESVFAFFKSRREDAALLWRPHPLMKATVESMHPHLASGYEGLVEKYRREDVGIYDDSADFHQALSVSDAYYGDHSSLVPLCREAGIPVMIQNVELREVH